MEGNSSDNKGLAARVAELEQKLESALEQVESLRKENRDLREQLEAAQRTAARQAAPFRRREKLKRSDGKKKRPGRKAGHAGRSRKKPPQVDEHHEVGLACCPECRGEIHDVRRVVQYIEEIPEIRPRVHRVVTYQAECSTCGPVRSRHPLQTTHRPGMALGPRATAIATALNKHHGLTMRRTCRVLKNLLGLSLTPGGLAQMVQRVAGRLAGDYEQLVADIRGAPACNADETSWWVGGPGWWLWTFTTPRSTLYRVEDNRRSDVVVETLGQDYVGVLGSDCLASYNPIDCRKHKCIAHHLRAIKKAEDLPGQNDEHYLRQWKLLLKMVIEFHRLAVRDEIDAETLAAKRQHFEAWVDKLLAEPVSQTGDAKIRNRLQKQRPHLLTCLYDLHADPTNNAAERALRPAVIARKLSCGNKTQRGKYAWEVLASLGQSLHQRGQNFIDFMTNHISPTPAS